LWKRTGAAAGTNPEFELLDTGVFQDDRYFDVFAEVRQSRDRRHSDPDHGTFNRGPDAATLHLLPTLWYRNTWSWGRPGRILAEAHVIARL